MAKAVYQAFECEFTGKLFRTEQEANDCSIEHVKMRIFSGKTPAEVACDLAFGGSLFWKAIDWCRINRDRLVDPAIGTAESADPREVRSDADHAKQFAAALALAEGRS